MKSIGVVSWKGGTGKTTLAFNLAERATHHGIDTTLCDFDPQANALDYFRIRNNYNPNAMQIKGVKGSLTVSGIDTLRKQSAQNQDGLLVCDLPGSRRVHTRPGLGHHEFAGHTCNCFAERGDGDAPVCGSCYGQQLASHGRAE